jgi:hypothetical protein
MMKPEEVRIFLIYATGQGSVFLTMPPDSYIREKFTRTIVAAPKHVREAFERYTKDRYQTVKAGARSNLTSRVGHEATEKT